MYFLILLIKIYNFLLSYKSKRIFIRTFYKNPQMRLMLKKKVYTRKVYLF